MAGKYAKYRGKLEAFAQEPDFQKKVDAEKRKHAKRDANALGKEFVRRKRAKNSLKRKDRQLNVELEALSQLLVDRLEGAEIESVKFRGGVGVGLQDKPYPSVADRRKLFGWIKQTRMTGLLSVHHQTLLGLVTEALEAGRPLPPGVDVFLKTSAKVTGLKDGDDD
jgi:hypothetical protein